IKGRNYGRSGPRICLLRITGHSTLMVNLAKISLPVCTIIVQVNNSVIVWNQKSIKNCQYFMY
ncbi:MAG: hypothetical protein ACM339_00940, partial [Ignavibacteria bacterium]